MKALKLPFTPLMLLLGCLFTDCDTPENEFEGTIPLEIKEVTIPETGLPEGLQPGMPVRVGGLKARDWENEFNGQKRHGISFRAVAITPAA